MGKAFFGEMVGARGEEWGRKGLSLSACITEQENKKIKKWMLTHQHKHKHMLQFSLCSLLNEGHISFSPKYHFFIYKN